MGKVWIITKRELSAFFDSLIAYVMIILFLGLSGSFTMVIWYQCFRIGSGKPGCFLQRGILVIVFLHTGHHDADDR